jgi:FAS-associated factor 2
VHEPDDVAQAQTFVQLFKSKFGDRHPSFVEVSWRDATFLAQRDFKFLFVYLHAPEHQVWVHT